MSSSADNSEYNHGINKVKLIELKHFLQQCTTVDTAVSHLITRSLDCRVYVAWCILFIYVIS